MLRLVLLNLWIKSHRELQENTEDEKDVTPNYKYILEKSREPENWLIEIKKAEPSLREKGDSMKNLTLVLYLLLNLFFIIYFLDNKSIVGLHFVSIVWALYFILNIFYSLNVIIKYRKHSNLNLLLALGVLTTSIGSFFRSLYFFITQWLVNPRR